MLILSYIAYAVLGIVAGILSGLLGISGGVVTIPFLLLIFNLLGFQNFHLMQLAIGTSLAAMSFNSLMSMLSYNRNQKIVWVIVKNMAPGLILGCILGAFFARALSTLFLQLLFGLFLLILGGYFYKEKKVYANKSSLPSPHALSGMGFGVGSLSNLLGIGGGVIVVPLLVSYHLSMRKSIGTSSAIAFIITFIGAICYLIFGFGEAIFPYTVGYIYLPAFTIIAATSFFSAPYGVYLAHKISTQKLKKFIAIALIIIGISMLYQSL